jgi:hypothetical protein
MKIKKFNENTFADAIMTQATFKIDPFGKIVHQMDIKKIHRSGRKIYIIDGAFEIVEIKQPFELRHLSGTKINELFPYVLAIREDFLETVKEKVALIKNIKELTDRKMTTLFEMVRAISQENGM